MTEGTERTAESEGNWVTVAEYATSRGCSPVTVYKRIKEGFIEKRSEDKKIDAKAADRDWHKGNKNVRAADTGPSTMSPVEQNKLVEQKTNLLEDRARTERLKADKEEIKLAQLRGELINKKSVLNQVQTVSRRNSDSWLNFAQNASVDLADVLGIEADEIFIHLDQAVRLHLEQLANMEFDFGSP